MNPRGVAYAPLKFNLKMRLTVLLLFVALSSLEANTVYSQSKRLSLNMEDAKIEDVIREIEAQSEFKFLYNRKDVNLERKLSVNFRKERIKDILASIFRNTNVYFEVLNKQIVLKRKLENQRVKKPLDDEEPPQLSVSGNIVDETGQPLPGASIVEKGTSNGTQSDFDGNFSLKVTNQNAVLTISYLGFKTKDVILDGQTDLSIVLEEDTAGLDEVVVVGYGVQKKVNLTGAVDVIDSKIIQNRPSPTVSQLLQGTSPGLSFSVGNSGFQPGAELDINIRGMGSINGGSPYVVIDGIPGNLNRLNPEDIESISVLKDASASAIYGARAPYGVILVTTKSGKKEKITATYSGSVSISAPAQLPSMLNSYTHARVLNEAGVSGAGGRFYSNDIVDNIVAYQAGDYDFIRSRDNFPQDAIYFETTPRNGGNTWGFNQRGNANRDWFDEYYGSGLITKHDLSVSGGGERTSYYLSAGVLNQEGVLNYGTDTFDRFNVMGKFTFAINKNWDITYQPRFSKTVREYPNMDKQGGYTLIFHQLARTMPSNAMYDGYGNYMIQSKIPWVNDAGTDVIETLENWQTFTTEIRPLKGWTIHADYAFRDTDYVKRDTELTVYDHQVDGTLVASGNTSPSSYEATHRSNIYWTSNLYTNYDFTLGGDHNLGFMVGAQFERTKVRTLSSYRTNLLVPEVPSLNTADGEIQSDEGLLTTSTEGFFGRFKYNFKEKYLLEANARYDGTSRFSEGSRWGFFPSFSAGWNVHKEPFWDSLAQVINTFKLKGSWGELGNQNVDAYQDLPLISFSGDAIRWIFEQGGTAPVGYAQTPSLISSNLTWETARSVNLGTSLSFFGNKLKTDFDWFERTTYDMIGPAQPQPGVIGATIPQENNATLRTRGWEINVNWGQTLNSGLSYNIGVNLFDSKAVVTEYLNSTGTLSTWYEGREQGEIWGYTAHDLYQSQEEIDTYTSEVDLSYITGLAWNTGDLKYLDTNGDGAVNNGSYTVDDHGDLSVIGNSTPRYQYGINANVAYKGFDLSMVWRGVGKRDISFHRSANIFWGFRTGPQSSLFPEHLDYYRDQEGDAYTGLYMGEANYNTDAYFPRPYLNNRQNNKNRETSTRYLRNAAYLRLQNLQLGYTLPTEILQKMKLSNLRVYMSGENLFTFSDLPVGIDPLALSSSWGAGKTYGADRIISLGLKIAY